MVAENTAAYFHKSVPNQTVQSSKPVKYRSHRSGWLKSKKSAETIRREKRVFDINTRPRACKIEIVNWFGYEVAKNRSVAVDLKSFDVNAKAGQQTL